MWGEAHDAFATVATIVLVSERDFVVADGHQPRIGDGGSMRVAGEIGEHALGSAERRLGVDDEGAVAERAHALGEGGGVGERAELAEEAEFAATEGRRQAVQGEPAERPRRRVDGQEEWQFQYGGRRGSFVELGAVIPSRIERRARCAPTRFRAPPTARATCSATVSTA